MQAPTASAIMVVELSVQRTASAAARMRSSVPGPAVRKSMKVSSGPPGSAAMAASASPTPVPERREVVARKRTPCVPWASRRNRVSASQSPSR